MFIHFSRLISIFFLPYKFGLAIHCFFVHWVWVVSYFRHSFRFGARRRKNFFRLSATSRWFAHGTEFKMYLFHTQLVWNFLACSTVVEKKMHQTTTLHTQRCTFEKNGERKTETKWKNANKFRHTQNSKSLANNSVNLIYFRLHFFYRHTHRVCVKKNGDCFWNMAVIILRARSHWLRQWGNVVCAIESVRRNAVTGVKSAPSLAYG